jgi:hypothetical protein
MATYRASLGARGEQKRRLHFTRMQALGVPLLVAVPLIGFSGIFKGNAVQHSVSLAGTTLDVRYPLKMQAGERSSVKATITNDSDKPAELKIKVSRGISEGFTSVRYKPQPAGYDQHHAVFYFPNVRPKESRSIEVELRADQAGMQEAVVLGMFDGIEGPRARVDIMISE